MNELSVISKSKQQHKLKLKTEAQNKLKTEAQNGKH